MPLTRRERQILEDLIKEVGKLKSRLKDAENNISILKNQVIGFGNTDFNNKTNSEKEAVIKDAVISLMKKHLPLHDHKSISAGGDAFAKKGANLISNQ